MYCSCISWTLYTTETRKGNGVMLCYFQTSTKNLFYLFILGKPPENLLFICVKQYLSFCRQGKSKAKEENYMSPLKYVQNAAHKILIFSRVECYLTLKTGTHHVAVCVVHGWYSRDGYTLLENFGGFHWKAYDSRC